MKLTKKIRRQSSWAGAAGRWAGGPGARQKSGLPDGMAVDRAHRAGIAAGR